MPRNVTFDNWICTNPNEGYCSQCDTLFLGTQHNCEEVADAIAAQDRRKAEADLNNAMLEAQEAHQRATEALRELCAEIKKRFC